MAWFKRIREAQRPFCTALVAAGGSSARMGTGHSKLLEQLDGIPVLAHTLRALEEAETVNAIVIAAREEDILPFSELCKSYGITKHVKIVLGGRDREESVYRAALEADPRTEFLAVQDGARPLVTPELIDAVVTAAFRCNAAAPAVPVRDTIKRREGDRVTETVDRESLAAVQTPQVFEASLLKAALQSAMEAGAALTDDCSAVERLGKIVYLVEGDPENLKITTPLDLVLAEAILEDRRRRA